MSEQLWYYSQDGRECGPVPLPRLMELTSNGMVKPADLVWREGMEDWTAAGKVPGLFPSAPPHAPTLPHSGGGTTMSNSTTLDKAQGAMRGALAGLSTPQLRGAQWLLISGIVLVVVARGCDRLNDRNVARLAAKQASARLDFENQWESKRLKLQQSQDALKKKTPLTPDDEKKLTDLRTELNDLLKDQGEERKELVEGRWRDLEIAANNAKLDNAISGYWHEMLFVFGAIVLTVGLILVGFSSQGPDRWIALGILAIIAYSLFVKGAAWTPGVGGL